MTHRELAEMIFKNKSIMNGYEPNATDDELIDYYAMLIEDYAKQKLSIASIGSKRLFSADEVVSLIKQQWIADYGNLNNDPESNQVNGAGYFVAGFVSTVLEATCDS